VILDVVDRGRQLAAEDVFDPHPAHGGQKLDRFTTVGGIAGRAQPTQVRAVHRSTTAGTATPPR